MADKPGSQRPHPPSQIKIDRKDETAGMVTKSMDGVDISAIIDDPTAGQQVKLKIQWSGDDFKPGTVKSKDSDYGKQGRRETLHMPNLKTDTLYKVRLWTVAKKAGEDQVSKQYSSASFWTNRTPTVQLIDPAENSEYEQREPNDTSTTILFDWRFLDADEQEPEQDAYRIRYKTTTGPWVHLPADGPETGKEGQKTFRRFEATRLSSNTTYLWTVKVKDKQGLWSEWPIPNSFFVRGASTPPTLVDPIRNVARVVKADANILFTWTFNDPDPKNKQTQADIRWRVVGTARVGFTTVDDGILEGDVGWVNHFGEGVTPGKTNQWLIPSGYFQAGFTYEWQVRTYDDKATGIPSGWSDSAQFNATVAPGSGNIEPLLPEETDPLGELGCGHHRVFIYDRPSYNVTLGRYQAALRGEIKPLAHVQWNRKRDDIANCLVDTNGFDQDCCELLGSLQSWQHEVVIFRDGERVFEGPITRITYTSENVQIEAKDVMAYLYRRVMRQGYNDRYRRIDLTPLTPPQPVNPAHPQKGGPYTIIGQNTVVERALQIALNALSYQDPNVLPYLTAITYPGDATESRVAADYSRSAWEEIDDLAATAGLDYVTIGRRIVFWDTHRTIGRLPEMRDGDFSDPVIVTEYGMNTANWYAVTNNSGVAGIAYPLKHGVNQPPTSSCPFHEDCTGEWHEFYGPVEMVSSAYGEQEAARVSTESLTAADREKLESKLTGQATKGISHRWPTPMVVRVPDNSTLNPQVNLGINQLVPGVWIPLRATLTCRKLAQWQKLDSVDVEEVGGSEAVRVTMSPAPHGGDDDPDTSGGEDAV